MNPRIHGFRRELTDVAADLLAGLRCEESESCVCVIATFPDGGCETTITASAQVTPRRDRAATRAVVEDDLQCGPSTAWRPKPAAPKRYSRAIVAAFEKTNVVAPNGGAPS